MEIVNFRLTALARRDWDPAKYTAAEPGDEPPVRSFRNVHFDDSGLVQAKIVDRQSLLAGHRITGPAIVEQLDTTTPVFPGDRAHVDDAGSLIIEIHA